MAHVHSEQGQSLANLMRAVLDQQTRIHLISHFSRNDFLTDVFLFFPRSSETLSLSISTAFFPPISLQLPTHSGLTEANRPSNFSRVKVGLVHVVNRLTALCTAAVVFFIHSQFFVKLD